MSKVIGQRSPRWSLFSVFRILNRDGSPYLTRLRILQTPWFGIYLHKIHSPDADRDHHDHPWSFVSVVLRGGYMEERKVPLPTLHAIPGEPRQWFWARRWLHRTPFTIGFRRATDLHRITTLDRKPTWTLVIVGPRRRDWGFQTDGGWVSADDYFKATS